MALEDQKLSERALTADATDAELHIIKPIGGGLYASWRITLTNLIKGVTDAIAAITAILNAGTLTIKHTNQTGDFTQAIAINTKLESIDFKYLSGSLTISVGTTPAGTEIINSLTLTSESASNLLDLIFDSAETLYFTISGGAVDVIINYRLNY